MRSLGQSREMLTLVALGSMSMSLVCGSGSYRCTSLSCRSGVMQRFPGPTIWSCQALSPNGEGNRSQVHVLAGGSDAPILH